MPSPLYSQFASLVSLIGIAASVTVLILALVRARNRGRTLVICGAVLVLAGSLLGEVLPMLPGLMTQIRDRVGVLGLANVFLALSAVWNLLMGLGVLLLALGLVRGHPRQPLREPIPAGQVFPAPPPPGPYPPYQGWPPATGMPDNDHDRGPR